MLLNHIKLGGCWGALKGEVATTSGLWPSLDSRSGVLSRWGAFYVGPEAMGCMA